MTPKYRDEKSIYAIYIYIYILKAKFLIDFKVQARAQGFAWIEGEGDGVEMSRIELVEYRPILLYFSFLPSSQTDHKYHEETSIC